MDRRNVTKEIEIDRLISEDKVGLSNLHKLLNRNIKERIFLSGDQKRYEIKAK